MQAQLNLFDPAPAPTIKPPDKELGLLFYCEKSKAQETVNDAVKSYQRRFGHLPRTILVRAGSLDYFKGIDFRGMEVVESPYPRKHDIFLPAGGPP